MSDLDARKDGHGVDILRGSTCIEDQEEDAQGIIPINKNKEEASKEEGLHTSKDQRKRRKFESNRWRSQ